jgi:hypothetical protein
VRVRASRGGRKQRESEPDSIWSSGKTPTSGSRLSARGGKEREARGLAGPGEAQAARPVGPCGRKGGEGRKAD